MGVIFTRIVSKKKMYKDFVLLFNEILLSSAEFETKKLMETLNGLFISRVTVLKNFPILLNPILFPQWNINYTIENNIFAQKVTEKCKGPFKLDGNQL